MKKIWALRFVALLLACAFFSGMVVSANAITDCNSDTNNPVEEIDTYRYYYNQLNEIEQRIYDGLVASKDDFMSNRMFTVTVDTYESREAISKQAYVNAAMRAREAYTRDDSEVSMWYKNSKMSLQFFKNHVNLVVYTNARTGRHADFKTEDIQVAVETFEKQAKEFVATLSGTDREKLKQIYDYLVQNVAYDHTCANPNTNNAYGALINHSCVCSGYAYAYKYLADLAGLKVLYVTGYIIPDKDKGSVYHAWNLVYLDGKWSLVDSCAGATNGKSEEYFMVKLDNNKMYYFEGKYFTYP